MKMTAKDVKEITYMPLVTFFSVLEWPPGKTVRGLQQPPLVRQGLMGKLWEAKRPDEESGNLDPDDAMEH